MEVADGMQANTNAAAEDAARRGRGVKAQALALRVSSVSRARAFLSSTSLVSAKPRDEPASCTVWLDGDGDSYGAGAPFLLDCDEMTDDHTLFDGDCDDSNSLVNPGAAEICDDGIDNNCNGLIDGAELDCATVDAPTSWVSGGGGCASCESNVAGERLQPRAMADLSVERIITRSAAIVGKDGNVKVTMHEVLRISPPPIDDELAKGMEFESLAKMREDLSARISEEKQRLGKQRQEDAALQFLTEAAKIPLPPSLVEEQQQASLNSLAQRMQQEGMPEEAVQKKLEESKDSSLQDAERRVTLFFLIEAVQIVQTIPTERSFSMS